MHSYAVRITHSYDTIKSLVDVWAEKCEKVAVYQHTGSETEKVHCHLVLLNSAVAKDQLKNFAKKLSVPLTGNQLCSFKKYDGNVTALVYMTKGNLVPSFLKSWSLEDSDSWKKKWVPQQTFKSKDAMLYEDVFSENTLTPALEDYLKNYDTNLYKSMGMLLPAYGERVFPFIKKWVHSEVFQRSGRIWNIRAINQYKMLVYSYYYRNSLKMPKDKTLSFDL